jgi:hypothetical protein
MEIVRSTIKRSKETEMAEGLKMRLMKLHQEYLEELLTVVERDFPDDRVIHLNITPEQLSDLCEFFNKRLYEEEI